MLPLPSLWWDWGGSPLQMRQRPSKIYQRPMNSKMPLIVICVIRVCTSWSCLSKIQQPLDDQTFKRQCILKSDSWPIGSMYGLFTYIYPKKATIHVGRYTVRPMDPSWVMLPPLRTDTPTDPKTPGWGGAVLHTGGPQDRCETQPGGQFFFFQQLKTPTPPKTNMEPQNEGLEDEFPFKWGEFQVPC